MNEAARAFLDDVVARHMAGRLSLVSAVEQVQAYGVAPARRAPSKGPGPRRLSAKNRARKGREWQLLARDYFRSQGYHVEVCHGKIAWIPDPATGKRRPISLAHDYFGCWDLAVCSAAERFWVQVCHVSDTATRRAKILASGFPCRPEDLILGHERGRVFRMLRGPEFALTEERVEVPR